MVTRERPRGSLAWERARLERGQDLAEAALVLPIVVVLTLIIIQAGILVLNYNSISNMAREGARYASINPPSADSTGACPSPLPTGTPGSALNAACQFAVGLVPAQATVNTVRLATNPTGAPRCYGPKGCVQVTVIYDAQLFFWLPGDASGFTMTSSSIMERER